MMKRYLLGGNGYFYKANLHVHSTVSDGCWTPEQIKEEYQKRGYSIIAFTDHNVMVSHNELTDENFLALTAYELNINAPNRITKDEFIKTYHLNFYAKDKNKAITPVFHPAFVWGNAVQYVSDAQKKIQYEMEYSLDCVNKIIEIMNADGFLVTYNHPTWSLQNHLDYMGLKGLWGCEVYNAGADLEGLRDTDIPFTDLLFEGNKIIPIASDDAHSIDTAFFGFSMIEAKSLDYDEVISAMEQGNIYSSTGPLINEISVESGIMTIKCDGARCITLISERRWTKSVRGEHITQVQFDLKEYLEDNAKYHPSVTYIRIVVEDGFGRKAWTRGYQEHELKER